MEVQISNEEYKFRITESVNRILDKLDQQLKDAFSLIITEAEDYKDVYTDKIIEMVIPYSLGIVKGNIAYKGRNRHMVIINMKNVDLLSLSEMELDGVVSHELGHIFNKFQEKSVPSILHGATLSEIKGVKLKNQKYTEFYADHFAKKIGTDTGLKTSIEKYLKSSLAKEPEIFKERLKKLESNDI